MAENTDDAIIKMQAASKWGDLLELRLDAMKSFALSRIIKASPKPLLVTYRSIKEGGLGNVSYSMRVAYLKEASALGAHYVDVEYSLPLEHRRMLFEACGADRIVLSRHLRHGTPANETLEDMFRKMSASGAHVVKMVTHAHSLWDNFRVLNLIAMAKNTGVQTVAFCMGEKGRISRVLCPLLGGMFTFAALEHGQESAPGQLTAEEIKAAWKVMRQ